MADETLKAIKTILGIDGNEQDDVINQVTQLITSRLKGKIHQKEVPNDLNYIVIEGSISRFNRINDEGKQSATESDVSATYQIDDLEPFAKDIADWIEANDADSNAGKFRFR